MNRDGVTIGAGRTRVRVLVIDHTAPVTSVRRRWKRVADSAAIDMTLLTPHAWPENSQWNDYRPEPDEPYRTVVGRVTVPGREVRSIYLEGIKRAMCESRPDVIVLMEEAFSAFAVQVLALRRRYAPSARIAFYACWIMPYDQMWYRPKAFFRWLSRTMIPRFDAAMCINDKATSALHDEGFAGARTNFFGVDEALFTKIARHEARAAVGLADDEAVFLYAGRLLELKGLDDLVDAFARVALDRADARPRLVLLGSGEHEGTLRERIARSGAADRIELRGSVPNEEIRTYMCAADAFVLPSRAAWREQFGRVLAEAMLVETPVIGSTSGEIPSVVADAGFIFDADDVDALAAAMRTIIDDPQEAGRRAGLGRDRALQEYSVGAFVRRTIDLIEELAGRSVRQQERDLIAS